MIYVASREDLKEVIKMALCIPKEFTEINLPSVSLEKTVDFIHECWLESPIFVFKEDGIIKGALGTQLGTQWWSDDLVLCDYMFYVKPEYRTDKRISKSLIEAVRDFGKLNKIPVLVHLISDKRTDAKKRLFKNAGFKDSGCVMTFGV